MSVHGPHAGCGGRQQQQQQQQEEQSIVQGVEEFHAFAGASHWSRWLQVTAAEDSLVPDNEWDPCAPDPSQAGLQKSAPFSLFFTLLFIFGTNYNRIRYYGCKEEKTNKCEFHSVVCQVNKERGKMISTQSLQLLGFLHKCLCKMSWGSCKTYLSVWDQEEKRQSKK